MNQFKTLTNSFFIGALAASALLTSCTVKKDDAAPIERFSNGVYVTNEGGFQKGNGSVSFFNTNSKIISNDIYGTANGGAALGDVVQSMYIVDSTAYVVVNYSNKVEVVRANTFKHITTITDVTSPRYFLPVSTQKAYISQWGSGTTGEIKILNLTNNAITGTIAVGNGPEKLLKYGNNIYVTCSGGHGFDENVYVINSTTDAVAAKIKAGPNPSGIVQDVDGKIWVLCSGQYNLYPTPGLQKSSKLVRINPATNTVEATFDFTSLTSQASSLTIDANKTTLYYTYSGKVFTLNINATALNPKSLINKSFYGLGIDPITNVIYGADATDYTSAGKIVRYNTNGVALDSATAGIATSGFYFK